MKTLIGHLIENNLDEIISKSLFNCHVKGMHSIMLLESPGKTIRLYVAEPDNELWANHPDNIKNGGTLSLAFHPHHCNLTIETVVGSLYNWEVVEVANGVSDLILDKFIYQSQIIDGDIFFKRANPDKVGIKTTNITWLPKGTSLPMKANAIHTVYCSRSEYTAWLVYEGLEDKNYVSNAYSNTDLTKESFEGLYQKPEDYYQIERLMKKIGLL